MTARRPLTISVAVLLLATLLTGVAPAQQSRFTFACDPKVSEQSVGTAVTITCAFFGPNGGVQGVRVQGEVLAGSVGDRDGSSPPPDMSATTDSDGRALFSVKAPAEGTDLICFWIDQDNDPNNINDGDLQCIDDDNTEPVRIDWISGGEVPLLTVARHGITKKKMNGLLGALGVKKNEGHRSIDRKSGSVIYQDREGGEVLRGSVAQGDAEEDGEPTVTDRLPIKRLERLEVISDRKAKRRTTKALESSGLEKGYVTGSGMKTTYLVSNSTLELLPVANPQEMERGRLRQQGDFRSGTFDIDTTVSFEQTVGGTPVTGPGANFRIAYNPNGDVALLMMAMHKVKLGPLVPIVTQAAGVQGCTDAATDRAGDPAGRFSIDAELVYHAPDLATKAESIYPHYLCTGTVMAGNSVIDMRPYLIPAVAAITIPRVTVEVTSSGPVVHASSTVTGGTPPYRYSWSSSMSETPEGVSTTGPSFSYTARTRGEEFEELETVRVVVTDANGVTARASGTTIVKPTVTPVSPATARISFGASYVGSSYADGSRLSHPGTNTRNFADAMRSAGVHQGYLLGERSVWDTDFTDTSIRPNGKDHVWADDVDMFWFTGHANGDGFVLSEGSTRDDDFVAWNEVRWGDKDLEFAVIAACGPLQEVWGGRDLRSRWGPVFQGLHMLNGYATVSSDGTEEGRIFARHLTGTGGLPAQSVLSAWSLAAIATQGPEVIHGSMGVVGRDWSSSINDHFWGFGPMSRDIRGGDIAGYWVLRRTS